VCSTEEGGIVEGFGSAVWATETGDKQEHATKIGMISRKIISCRPTLNQSALMLCMRSSMNYEINTKALAGLTAMTERNRADNQTVSASLSRNGKDKNELYSHIEHVFYVSQST